MSSRSLVLFAGLLALAACVHADVRALQPAAAREQALLRARHERSVSDFLGTLGSSSRKANKDQSFNIGGVYQYDRQLANRSVYKSSTLMTENKEYLSFSSSATIHCIQIVDNLKTGKNAVVTVQNGGIGQKSVNMRFKSQRGEKINYLVIIWGQ